MIANRTWRSDMPRKRKRGGSLVAELAFSPSKAVNNVLEHNHIHDLGQGMLSDLGGICTLGVSPGAQLRNNELHSVKREIPIRLRNEQEP